MNCDDVFDVLTRGPFPSGDENDEYVERHLATCADCRRLAEALRPAVELLQEAILPEESHGLPGYRGQVACSDRELPFEYEPAGAVAQATAKATLPVRALGRPGASVLRFAAAVLIGVMAAAGWRGWTAPHARDSGPTPVTVAGDRGANDGQPAMMQPDRRWLAGLVLPPVCRDTADRGKPFMAVTGEPSLPGVQVASLDTSDLTCCTDCHSSATSGRLSPHAQTIVARACLACHQN